MQNRALRNRWFIALLTCLATSANGQRSAVLAQGGGAVTIDASRLNAMISLDAPWRFQPGDNPRFADSGYDDSPWSLVRPGVNRLLANEHAPDVPTGQFWARLHVHILNANGPLAVTLTARNAMPYAVFADGKQIGASKGFVPGRIYWMKASSIVLPNTPDFVLALHFVMPGQPVLHYFPLTQVVLGQSEAMGDRTDLDRYRFFEEERLSWVVLSILFLAIVPVGFTLLFAQRDHPEYLWLALFSFFVGLAYTGFVARNTGFLRGGLGSYALLMGSEAVAFACGLEFTAVLAQFRRGTFLRLVQAMVLFQPLLLYAHNPNWWTATLVLEAALWPVLIVSILFGAWRRGKRECGLLMLPMIFLPLSLLLSQLEDSYPAWFVYEPGLHFAGIGFSVYHLASVLFLVGLVAVVLYRFIRVSKDEQIAASEFEAARTVQRLLISEALPTTSGFSVESVYLPAQQVGGDFFLVLPPPKGSQETSLLAVIGDVSGKGLQAAMVVATIMGGLRMQMSRAPAEVLSYLNRMLVGHISGFATCCAVLIHQDGRMQIANAGNPSPYSDGKELLTFPGLPLGIDGQVVYEQTDHVLAVGDRLAFVSDGVLEATSFPRKELFGFDRTRAISTQSAHAIAEAASLFGAGAPQADDITVLTVSLHPAA